MVKRHQPHAEIAHTPTHFDTWLQHLIDQRGKQDIKLLQCAHDLNSKIDNHEIRSRCIKEGLAMAGILLELELDTEALTAALLYPAVHSGEIELDHIAEQIGESVVKLLRGVQQMNALDTLLAAQNKAHAQLENLRKMLLAMVYDVRAVLIKLAERSYLLRTAKELAPALRHSFAHETMNIYAPLANRLGIGHLKWEMEDLCFRYLQPRI